ncbi:MAG: cytochrome b/b6 domain-containing protein, partial [Proteobacteria bacterium]|nr:cytochrome b/b6 domain-containing protein [Pseudomonadota bacterium]MBU1453089.1 cytochrome b/b6 domain-containing protein [Pseudomonadota bacterium]
MKTENKVLIWDLPTRIFHWLLVCGFVAAALIAFIFGEHSPLFPYHAVVGLILGVMVVLRVIWGFVGTKYARFTSFFFSPGAVFNYVTGVLRGVAAPYVGHNPGSAYAIFAMLVMLVGLPVSGIMILRGGEAFEEVHEFFAYTMILVIAVHILGVVLHTIRHKENITVSMVHGRKAADPADAISSAQPIIAIIFVFIVATWAWALVSNYDSQRQSIRLPVLGTEL